MKGSSTFFLAKQCQLIKLGVVIFILADVVHNKAGVDSTEPRARWAVVKQARVPAVMRKGSKLGNAKRGSTSAPEKAGPELAHNRLFAYARSRLEYCTVDIRAIERRGHGTPVTMAKP